METGFEMAMGGRRRRIDSEFGMPDGRLWGGILNSQFSILNCRRGEAMGLIGVWWPRLGLSRCRCSWGDAELELGVPRAAWPHPGIVEQSATGSGAGVWGSRRGLDKKQKITKAESPADSGASGFCVDAWFGSARSYAWLIFTIKFCRGGQDHLQ
jgi:hypothetical protein